MPVKVDPSPLDESKTYGNFLDDLVRDGFVVVPGVTPPERAAKYVEAAHDWLESFDLGYKRDDSSTYSLDKLPVCGKGGLFNKYGVAHTQFCWDIRQEPALVDVFAKIWGTDELLVSFDGANISVPLDLSKPGYEDINKSWPHVDQSPLRRHMHCIQGIMNLAPNGPNDGGLKVLRGSKALYSELFDAFEKDKPEGGWSEEDGFNFSDEMMQWFYDRGCKWEKLCAGPGDVLLWDSRVCHYGAPPLAKNPRVATYVCYKPAKLASETAKAQRQVALDTMRNTVHDPCYPDFVSNEPPNRDGKPDPAWERQPLPPQKPKLNELGRKLAGVEAY